jgi:hypothetical protein
MLEIQIKLEADNVSDIGITTASISFPINYQRLNKRTRNVL